MLTISVKCKTEMKMVSTQKGSGNRTNSSQLWRIRRYSFGHAAFTNVTFNKFSFGNMFFLPTYATPVSWPIFLWSNNVDCFIFSNSCLLDLLMTCLFTHFVNCISLQKSVYIKFLKISLQLSEYDILKRCPGRMESILLDILNFLLLLSWRNYAKHNKYCLDQNCFTLSRNVGSTWRAWGVAKGGF